MRRDFSLDVVEVGLPGVVFIQIIGVQLNPELRQHRGIQWIIRTGSKNVFAGIQQRRQADIDALADTRGHEHVPNGADALALAFGANRVKRFFDPGGGSIAVLAVLHRLVYGFDQVSRSVEVKGNGITDVQWQNLVPLRGDFIG